MLDLINQWVADYQGYFILVGIISTIVFIVSIALMPYLLGLIDVHYFVNLPERALPINSLPQLLLIIIKSVLGFVLLIAGIIMLLTPGQGVICILLALFLMEFPGKHKLELKLIHHQPTFKTLNWLRAKAGKPPFSR